MGLLLSLLTWGVQYTEDGMEGDEAGLTRKFETSPVGGTTCRKTPISLSALEKNPRPAPWGQLSL